MDIFSTRGLPSAQKVSFWNSISSEVFAAMEIAPRNPGSFDGQIRREALGPLTLVTVQSAAVCIRHTAAHLARRAHDSFLLLAPLNGPMQLELPGTDPIHVLAGHFRLIDNSRPYTIRHGDGLQTLCLDIPHASLQRIVDRPGRWVGVRPSGSQRVQQSLLGLLNGLSAPPGAEACDASAAGVLSDVLVNLVGATFAQSPPAAPASSDRASRIRAAIDAAADDPGLRQQDIAAQLGLSTRTLRAVLEQTGEGFCAYLLRRRLERAALRLRAPALQAVGITQLALESGFNNATHFGFAFKRRYGVTPRRYRNCPDT